MEMDAKTGDDACVFDGDDVCWRCAYHVMIIHCTGARQADSQRICICTETNGGHGHSAVGGGATHYQT